MWHRSTASADILRPFCLTLRQPLTARRSSACKHRGLPILRGWIGCAVRCGRMRSSVSALCRRTLYGWN